MELIQKTDTKRIYRKKIKLKDYPRFILYSVYIVIERITFEGTFTTCKFGYKECENKNGGKNE